MKLSELMSPVNQAPLNEGTWELPDTPKKVQDVLKLLDGPPIKSWDKRARKKIGDLLGSDSLFDDLDKAEDDMVDDVRPVLIKHLPSFLDTSRWVRKPDEQTQFFVNLLKKKYGIKDDK